MANTIRLSDPATILTHSEEVILAKVILVEEHARITSSDQSTILQQSSLSPQPKEVILAKEQGSLRQGSDIYQYTK